MSRYIDATALLEKVEQEQRFCMDEYNAMESGYMDEERELARTAYSTMADCVALIINAPTVDAVPVVRCKYCIQHEEGFKTKSGRLYCCYLHVTVDPMGYCDNGDEKHGKQ